MMKFITLLFCLLISLQALAARSLDITELAPGVQKDLLKRFPQAGSSGISMESVDNIIRWLQAYPDYDAIQVLDMGGGNLKIHTVRAIRIAKIQFQGLKALSESDAKNTMGISTDDVFNQDSLVAGAEKLQQAYAQIGYRSMTVDIDLPSDDKGNKDLKVIVKEGPQTKIQKLVFSSANTELNKILESRLSGQKGNALTDLQLAEIQKKIRDILNSRFYVRAEVQGPETSYNADESQATLTYKMDKVDSYSIEFVGNKEVSSSALNQHLEFGSFYTANPNIGTELAGKVKGLYLSRGYARVEVSADDMEGRKPFTRKIVLTIEEGPKIKIGRYDFSGNYSRDNNFYVKLLKKNASSLIEKDYYNKADLEVAFENLRIELQNEGYLLAKINSTRTQYNKEKNQVAIYVNLDEGPLTEIESIDFLGNEAIPSAELLKVVDLQKGALKLGELDAALTRLKNYYYEHGYIDMALLNEKEDLVNYNENNTKARLNFKIYEGPQVKAASIIIDGNKFTKDYVVLNEIDIKPGDLVTPAKIIESTARLQRTGYFSTVEIKTLEEKTNVSNRTLVIKVSETNPGLFTMGAGATNERELTLRGYLGVAYNNILGTGRGASVRLEGNYNIADVKYLESKIVFGYVEPYLFDSKYRFRINLTRSSQVTDYELKKVTDVQQVTYSIEKDFTSHITGIWNVWSLARVHDYGLNPDDPANPQNNVADIKQDIATIGPTLELDYRDNPFNPTRGSWSNFSVEYASPSLGSTETIEYLRSMATVTTYVPMAMKDRTWVWANSLRGGYLQNLSKLDDGGVPYDKKGFYLGGGTTIRGFDGTKEYFPSLEQLGATASNPYILKGFSSMYLIKSELRFPLFGNIGGAVFYDGGAVHIQDLNLGDEYRDSAGFGIHYNTPVGPVNLEWAWKLDAKPGEDPWRFHLSIGSF